MLALTAPAAASAAGAELRVKDTTGKVTAVPVAAPTTLDQLLADAGLLEFDLDHLDVVGTTSLRLSRKQAFGGRVAVEPAEGGLRLSFGRSEVMSADGALTARLGFAAGFEVKATAEDATVDVGDAVRFSATVEDLPDGQTPRIRWTIPSAGRLSGARVTHTFSKPGRYTVAVGVTTAADRAGAFDHLTVQVGRPKADPTPTPTPAAAAPTPPPAAGVAPLDADPGGPGGAAAGTPAPRPRAAATPTPTPTTTATAAPRGRLVRGEVIDARLVSAVAAPAAAPAGPDPDQDGGGFRLSGEAVGGSVALLLAWAGFRLDMRRARHTWR